MGSQLYSAWSAVYVRAIGEVCNKKQSILQSFIVTLYQFMHDPYSDKVNVPQVKYNVQIQCGHMYNTMFIALGEF